MIKAKISFDWDTLRKAIEEGKIKFEPPSSHFREETMRAWERGRDHALDDASLRSTGRLRPNYVHTPQLPEHPNMPMAYPLTTRMYMDYKARVRELLGEDFERLTAQSVILDDHCMLLLEQFNEIVEAMQHEIAFTGSILANDPLQIRRDQIRDEFALASALILRYPEVQRQYEMKSHIQLGWHQLAYLALMPLNNTPFRDMIVRMYTECVVENADALTVRG